MFNYFHYVYEHESTYFDKHPKLVQEIQQPLWPAFDERAHDLVVEVLDGRPLDTLRGILFLLCLERELDEDLLQLLVHVVDAELLKGVAFEDLEAVNIQEADGVHALVVLVDGAVDA